MDWSHVCGIGNREGNNGSNLWDCLKYTWLHGLVDGEGRFVGLTPGCMDWSHIFLEFESEMGRSNVGDLWDCLKYT